MSDFDHCKENIQPQRRGHSSAELINLNRMNDPEYRAKVKAEEVQWEQRLRLDESDIQVWSEYIEWAEMNLYSQIQLNELKQKAMAKFIKPEFQQLANDVRLFEIFLKSIGKGLDRGKRWLTVVYVVKYVNCGTLNPIEKINQKIGEIYLVLYVQSHFS